MNTHGLPEPLWWRVMRRLRLVRVANWIYAKRYGRWAPGLHDCCASTPLHGLAVDPAAAWLISPTHTPDAIRPKGMI